MPEIAVSRSSEGGMLWLRPVGILTHTSAPEIEQAVTRALLDAGRVLVDLDALEIEDAERVLVFATALNEAGGWPQAQLVLYGGNPDTVRILTNSSVTRTVPHTDTAEDAVALFAVRPPLVRKRASLTRQPIAALLARELVADVCTAWDVPEESTFSAQLVVSELVTNVIEHAGTACLVVIELTGTELRLSVQDGSHESPVMQDRNPLAESGRGLQIVTALAHHWGVTNRAGHKIIWAIIETDTTGRTG